MIEQICVPIVVISVLAGAIYYGYLKHKTGKDPKFRLPIYVDE